MIYEVEDGYVISSHSVWRPGVFDSRKAAHYARLFTDEQIIDIGGDWKEGPVKTITFEMLKDAK